MFVFFFILPTGSNFLNSNLGDVLGLLNVYVNPVPALLNNLAAMTLNSIIIDV